MLGFKDTNQEVQKNIADLLTKKRISSYIAPAAPAFTAYSKTIQRSGKESNSALYFIDFGKKSVNALVMVNLFNSIINTAITSVPNSSNSSIVNSVHLT